MRVSPTKNLQTPTDCLWKSVNSTVELAEINSSFGKVSGSIQDPGSQATRKPLELLSTPLIACFKPFILSCKEKLLKTIINPQVLTWCMLLGIACLNKRIFLPWAGWDMAVDLWYPRSQPSVSITHHALTVIIADWAQATCQICQHQAPAIPEDGTLDVHGARSCMAKLPSCGHG